MKAFKTKSSTEGWSWMKAIQREVDQQSLVKGKIPLGLSDSAQGFPSPPPARAGEIRGRSEKHSLLRSRMSCRGRAQFILPHTQSVALWQTLSIAYLKPSPHIPFLPANPSSIWSAREGLAKQLQRRSLLLRRLLL